MIGIWTLSTGHNPANIFALGSGQFSTLLIWYLTARISIDITARTAASEEVRQPVVIRKAGEYLRFMTGGRYSLQSTFDGRQLFAVDGMQRRIPEKEWSSGLGDQIYLAIRISLAVAFSHQIESMPLILDDILVRFDEERQKEAIRFLAAA